MWRYLKNSFVLNFILIILAAIVGYSSFSMISRAVGLYRERKAGDEKIKELSEKKEELTARIAEFGTPEVLEREAKLRLNLKRKGEEVVVVLPDDKMSGRASTSDSLWDKLLDFIYLK